jgi:hypothetical protein
MRRLDRDDGLGQGKQVLVWGELAARRRSVRTLA